jgi:hypothetical protein
MTYTEEELEALADAAGVRWKTEISSVDVPISNKWYAWIAGYTGCSYGGTRQEAMNHYWNQHINSDAVKPFRVTPK